MQHPRDRQSRTLLIFSVLFHTLTLVSPVFAQSLSQRAPTPLVAGENHGTLDNMVGPQFWVFKYLKGPGKVTVNFTSMGLFGNRQNTTIEVVFLDPNGKVIDTKSLTSHGTAAQLELPANFVHPGTMVVELRPTGMALVRAGGDYSITLSGPAIDFAGVKAAGPEQIAGTYSMMVCPPDFDCQAVRFQANGAVMTADGRNGTWKAFDPDGLIYTVVIGGDRWSLKLIPGRGLVNVSDTSVVVFQAVKGR